MKDSLENLIIGCSTVICILILVVSIIVTSDIEEIITENNIALMECSDENRELKFMLNKSNLELQTILDHINNVENIILPK